MKSLVLVLLIPLLLTVSFAQEKESTSVSFALRGKIFGFFVIEDTYFTTGTIGGEFLLGNKHSIGIDYTYFAWQYQTDGDFTDSSGNLIHDVSLYNQYTRRPYFLFDYKYNLHNHGDDFSLYLNLCTKLGEYKEWYGENYNEKYLTSRPVILDNTINGVFNEVGVGVGFKGYFTESNLGYDISANYARRTNKNKVTIPSLNVYDKKENSIKNLLYIRINFFYHFGR